MVEKETFCLTQSRNSIQVLRLHGWGLGENSDPDNCNCQYDKRDEHDRTDHFRDRVSTGHLSPSCGCILFTNTFCLLCDVPMLFHLDP